MLIPAILYYLIFCYGPMYGAIIAFKDYSPRLGILGSNWVGLKHFISFFESPYFFRILRNTVGISFSTLIFGFPAPIILALLINELKSKSYAKLTQTITYLPHFISLVVVCGMIKDFTLNTGLINNILTLLTGGAWEAKTLLNSAEYFIPIYVISDIWQGVGWGSIIYFATLSGVDKSLLEAAEIDGANRFHKIWYINIPLLIPTIVILLILQCGSLLSVGYEKVYLLQNSTNLSGSEVISTYVYKVGLEQADFGFGTATDLFNALVNTAILLSANFLAKKTTEQGLF